MSAAATPRFKIALGLLLGLVIGALCKVLGIPSPAPSAIPGALLVIAMTLGYTIADWWLCTDVAQHRDNCAGPDGSIKGRK